MPVYTCTCMIVLNTCTYNHHAQIIMHIVHGTRLQSRHLCTLHTQSTHVCICTYMYVHVPIGGRGCTCRGPHGLSAGTSICTAQVFHVVLPTLTHKLLPVPPLGTAVLGAGWSGSLRGIVGVQRGEGHGTEVAPAQTQIQSNVGTSRY